MLNITGGGKEKLKGENDIIHLKSKHVFDINPDVETVKDILNKDSYLSMNNNKI